MQSMLETCQPRSDILTGSFNPEIFTASLSQVMDYYRGRATRISKWWPRCNLPRRWASSTVRLRSPMIAFILEQGGN